MAPDTAASTSLNGRSAFETNDKTQAITVFKQMLERLPSLP